MHWVHLLVGKQGGQASIMVLGLIVFRIVLFTQVISRELLARLATLSSWEPN